MADDPYTVPVTVTYSDGTIDNVDAKITVTEKAATDKAGLAAEIAKECEVKGAGGFKNASQEKKQAYKDALAEVDAALKALNDASSALDGKTTADGKSGEKSVGAQLRKLAKTGAQTSWLWLSALLAGSGAVLVSKRRRKDEQDA